MAQQGYILAMNCGSSGIKFTLFSATKLALILRGDIALTDTVESHFRITDNKGLVLVNYPIARQEMRIAVHEVISWFHLNRQHYPLAAIGHRVVQGGPNHRSPCIIDSALVKTLQQLVYLAPNHLPDDIITIKAFRKSFPDALQVACFDNSFTRDMPDIAKYYPLPRHYREHGLLRYGFHGLSCEYIMRRLGKAISAADAKKIIIAHLGNGCSLTAVQNGKAIDTTMGISPMGGVVMGTRPGDIDPGVLFFLLNEEKLTPDELELLLSKNAGLKAIAGHSDMELLLACEEKDARAKEAVATFCYQAQKAIGSLAAALGGLDILVFTGGVGQHSASIRQRICDPLTFMGITVNKAANNANRQLISRHSKRVKIYVLATNEELVIAAHTQQLLQQQKTKNNERADH